MLQIFQVRPALVIAICALGVAACGKSGQEPQKPSPLSDTAGLLRYVPADTPYVFGTVVPPPDDFMDAMEPKVDRLLAAYADVMRAAVRDAPSHEDSDADAEAMPQPLIDELTTLMSVEGLRNAGVTRKSKVMLYGNGLLPVLRVTLSDAALFEEAIARIEADAGEKLPVTEVDGRSLRYFEDEGVRVFVATIDDQLVVTGAPAAIGEADLARLLGLKLPEKNIAETPKLRDIAEHYGFLHEYVGMVDTERLAATFLDRPEGLDAMLLEAMGYEAGELSDVCKAEFRALARVLPRVVAGYEEVSAERIRSTSVVEMRDDIAAEFTTFPAPVPGLGKFDAGLMSLGISFNFKELRAFIEKQYEKLKANPWQCEHLADLQSRMLASAEQGLSQPVPPALYDFRGFLAVINDMQGFDPARQQPPEAIDASFLLAIDNAQGLLAMGQMMVPQLAEMVIEPDGKPHRFELPEEQGRVDGAWIAMTESALALSVSEDGDKVLPAMLAAEGATPPPFLSMGLDGKEYYAMLGKATRESEDEEMSEAMRDAMSAVISAAEDFYERLKIDVTFTENGIEIDTSLALAP